MPLYPVTDKATNMEFSRVEDILKTATGIVVEFYGKEIPQGWLSLDGSLKAIGDYPNLFSLLNLNGKIATPGTNSFRLPTAAGKIIKV